MCMYGQGMFNLFQLQMINDKQSSFGTAIRDKKSKFLRSIKPGARSSYGYPEF